LSYSNYELIKTNIGKTESNLAYLKIEPEMAKRLFIDPIFEC